MPVSVCVVRAGIAALWMSAQPVGETVAERDIRLDLVARSAAFAANVVTTPSPSRWPGSATELAAASITVAWFESGLIKRIHAGDCRKNECDATRRFDGTIYHRARGLWQLQEHRYLPRADWLQVAGLGEQQTYFAAQAATNALVRARNMCRGGPKTWAPRMISAYATGSRCEWRRAYARVKVMNRVEAAMRAAECGAS